MARACHVVQKPGHCSLLESCAHGRLFVRKQNHLGTLIIRTTPIFSLCVYVNILFILVSGEVMLENCLYVFYLSICNDAYFGLFRAFTCQ